MQKIVVPTSHPLRGYESPPQFDAPRVRQIVARHHVTFQNHFAGYKVRLAMRAEASIRDADVQRCWQLGRTINET